MDGWKTFFLLGRLIIRGELLVLGRVGFKLLDPFFLLDLKGHFFFAAFRVRCVISFWGERFGGWYPTDVKAIIYRRL